MHGLKNIRVIDFSSGVAGPYTSKLLADAGADVIKVESAAGDPMRRWSATQGQDDANEGDSAFFHYLNGNKRAVCGEPGDAAINDLIASADLVIEDFQTNSPALSKLDVAGLLESQPQLVVLSISAYGRTGPYATRPASEFTVQAECGSTLSRGLASEPPYMAGGRVSDFVGASYASVATLAAVKYAQASGLGDHIDFSLTEAMHIASTIYTDLMFSMLGRPALENPFRTVELPSIEPSSDGWVGFNTNSRQQYDDFTLLIERPELMLDDELASIMGRQARAEEWNTAVRDWTCKHSTAEIVEAAARLRIPVAPVLDGSGVLEHEQFKAREMFAKNPAGEFMQPLPPYKLNGERPAIRKPAPGLDEHSARIETRQATKLAVADEERKLPLSGIRVLDATAWWAGPAATQMLAMLGADVIHLEAIQRMDGGRTALPGPVPGDWWECSQLHNGTNTNKRSLTLNLNDEQGRALTKQLIGECDVLVENYSPRVFENFGLDRDAVHKLNPGIVFARMPAFGLDGPWRDHVGFAQTMEQISGLAWVTGHADDQPRIQRGPCDPIAGMHAAFAILVALQEREHSGEAQFLECAMVEAALNVAAEQSVEFSAYGNILQREGNRSPYAAPQGVYACEGEENWLALSVTNDEQWQALVAVMGKPAWAGNSTLSTHTGRRAAQDLLDEEITQWVARRELDKLVETLVAHGIPAAKLAFGGDASMHPQMVARNFFETVDHPVIGTHPLTGMPFRFASRGNKGWISRHAPLIGQHNHEILSEILGLEDSEIAALEEQAIIGSKPLL